METRALGKSGLTVPVVGMGTWSTFDVRGTADEAHARAVVDVALEHGANFFDSSPMYGEAERVLGASLTGRRSSALVATKVWTPSASEGQRQIQRALEFFGGTIDVYQVHNLVNWRHHLDVREPFGTIGPVHEQVSECIGAPREGCGHSSSVQDVVECSLCGSRGAVCEFGL